MVMEKTKEEIDGVEERLNNIIATRPSSVASCHNANINSMNFLTNFSFRLKLKKT